MNACFVTQISHANPILISSLFSNTAFALDACCMHHFPHETAQQAPPPSLLKK